MSARPSGPNSGVITCDTKTIKGPCRNEFDSLESETYLRCEVRAFQAGWVRAKQIMNGHLCPEHAWLMRTC